MTTINTLPELLNKFNGYHKTCSLDELTDYSVAFVRNNKFFNKLRGLNRDVFVITPFPSI